MNKREATTRANRASTSQGEQAHRRAQNGDEPSRTARVEPNCDELKRVPASVDILANPLLDAAAVHLQSAMRARPCIDWRTSRFNILRKSSAREQACVRERAKAKRACMHSTPCMWKATFVSLARGWRTVQRCDLRVVT